MSDTKIALGRGERGPRGHAGPTGPTGPTGLLESAFSPTFNTIYVRPNGNDSSGTGSITSPFATLQRAVLAVPLIVSAGQIYRIDITGITEALPSDYALPAWKTWATENPNAPGPITNFQTGIEIYAQPQPVAALTSAETVINAVDVASTTQDPITELWTINLTVPRPDWTTANLLGKQVLDGSGNPNNHAVVGRVNSTSSILITNTVAPTFPLQLVEPSATLHGSATNYGTIVANNIDNMGFTGVRILSDNDETGLMAAGSGNCICQFCELQSPSLLQQSGSVFYAQANRVLRSWTYDFPTFSGVIGIVQGLMQNCTPNSNFGAPFFCAPTDVTVRRAVFTGCDPIEVTTYDPGGAVDPASATHINVQNTLVTLGTSDGMDFHGVRALVQNVDFAANTGNGITVSNGAGLLALQDVGSSVANVGAYGLQISDGMQVTADAATTGNATPLAGATNQVKVGGLAAQTWASVAIVFAAGDGVPDYTGATATGARLASS